ncbi:MAG: glycine cleavage system aminomethyltransferase GcvT [bacterium]
MPHARRTVLYETHVTAGARMVDFAGWEMPVQYTSILAEHHAVRKAAGLFDISHMGEFFVSGAQAVSWLNGLLTNDARKIPVGGSQYTLMLNEQGGVIDDLILYRLEEEGFLLVVNASRIDEDWAWLNSKKTSGVLLENRSHETAALALQGPLSEKILRIVFGQETNLPTHAQITSLSWRGEKILVARTGYTGEDGFEFFLPASIVRDFWAQLLEIGKPFGCLPCGLGARDTLRLEACLPLNGNDLSPSITPLEAGLSKFVSLTKPENFPGRSAMENKTPARKSVAFVLKETGAPPRSHYAVFSGDNKIGDVTSGGFSPTLQKGVGLALIERGHAAPEFEIEIRGQRAPALMQPKPLYKRL